MGANLHANGGLLKKPLHLPDFRNYEAKFEPGQLEAENMRPLGKFLRDVMKLNMNTFRIFGPDENTSNKLDNVYVSKKFWIAEYFPETAMAASYRPTDVSSKCLVSTHWRHVRRVCPYG